MLGGNPFHIFVFFFFRDFVMMVFHNFIELDGCRALTNCHSVAMLMTEDICRMITIIVLKPPSRLPLGIAGADLFKLETTRSISQQYSHHSQSRLLSTCIEKCF